MQDQRGGRDDDDDLSSLATSASSSNSSLPAPPCCVSKKAFDNANGSKKLLLSMCCGLFASDEPGARALGEFNVEPYLSAKNKKFFKPSRSDLVAEVYRRLKELSKQEQRHDSRTVEFLKKWLTENKIENPTDVAFLRSEEAKLYNQLQRAQQESALLQPQQQPGIIFTHTADLRMVHCLLEDDVKQAFLARHDCMDRQSLDARNSPNRPKTWLEKISDKFNCNNFSPYTEVFPYLHDDFAEPIDLSLVHCPAAVSPDQVKGWVADRKAKLVLLIDRWERSGNGDGQRMEDDSDFGHLQNLDFQSDNRSSFLKNDRSSLLYFWQMLDKYDILQQTVSILPRELGVSSMSNVSSVSDNSNVVNGSARKKQRTNVAGGASSGDDRDSLHQTLRELASGFSSSNETSKKAVAMEVLQKAEETYIRYVQLLQDATSPGVKAIYEDRLAKSKSRLEKAESDYEQANSV